MDRNQLLQRVSVSPKVMVGKPVIRGTRLTVQYIVGLLSQGMSIDQVLSEYPGIEREDVLACLAFAADSLDRSTISPLLEVAE